MPTIRSLLDDNVTLVCHSVDRIFLHGYVAGLQTAGQLIRFLLHRGYPIPSPAALGKIGKQYVADLEAFFEREQVPVIRFGKKERKEEVARPHLEKAAVERREGVVLVRVAQERVTGWRGWRQGGSDGHPHFEYARQSLFVNHYYVYVFDREWGPCFFKLCGYAPYPIWVWCKGHEWAKQQLVKSGVGFTGLDNGFGSCEDPKFLHRTCARLSAGATRALCERWLSRLPSPFTPEDREIGCFHDFSIRQLEVSDTRVFDRPDSGRRWFEQTIREHLDAGRPDHVSLVFNRRINKRTPGRFQTRVITEGVDPALYIRYKASKIKQYFKEGRALRTETVINDPYDFGVGRRLTSQNWNTLRRVGRQANQRLLDAQAAAVGCAPDATTLEQVVLPSRSDDGQPVPGLRFGDPRVHAVLSALCGFAHTTWGITNKTLRERVQALLDRPYATKQMSYDLRRLRRKGFIARIHGTNNYLLTDEGRRLTFFLSKTYCRIVVPGLAELDPTLPADIKARSGLALAWHHLDTEIKAHIKAATIAA